MTNTSATQASSRAATAVYVSRVRELVYQLARLMARCDDTCLAQHGITVTQGYALMSFPDEGDLSMNALGEAIEVAGSTATRMVDQLVKKGLVDRRPDPEDRRIVRVTLTPRGRELRRQMEEATETCFRVAFGALAAAERPAVVRVLELITGSLAKALEAFGGASWRAK